MSVTPEELLEHIRHLGIEVSTVGHPPLHTVEQSRAQRGAIPGGHCKNLFLRDHKKRFWLIVTLEDAVIDLKAIASRIGSGRLSFASADRLREHLGVEPGSVTPFAVINDHEGTVQVVLDEAMMRENPLNFHPLVNTRTTTIDRDDLLRFLKATGHEPLIASISG